MGRLLGSVIWLTSFGGLGIFLFKTLTPDETTFKDLPSQTASGRIESMQKKEQILKVLREAASVK